MKSSRTNEALMQAFAHVQAAACIMGGLDELDNDPLFRVSSANDELDFQELQNIADSLYNKLCSMAPKFRLLIYTGAPKGTVYKKAPDPEQAKTAALIDEIKRRGVKIEL